MLEWRSSAVDSIMPWKVATHGQTQRRTAKNRSGDPFYSGAPWRRFRKGFIASHPICADIHGFHKADGATVATTEVDHILDRKTYPHLAYDEDNCRGLCKACHSRRTMMDG